jgi:hypothetical protein
MQHKSFGIGTKSIFSRSAECGTHNIYFQLTLRTAVLFRYLQLQKVVPEHPANVN